jgi:hypothetical protein
VEHTPGDDRAAQGPVRQRPQQQPDPRRTGFHDPRQHAVALVYLVPVTGTCEPAKDALDFSWMTPEEVTSPLVVAEMSSGHDRLVRIALAHAQRLP